MKRAVVRVATTLAAMSLTFGSMVGMAQARPASDAFYHYTGPTPLSAVKPGTVLRTRTLAFHVSGIATPIKAVQLVYRTNDAQDHPTAAVTSVLLPPRGVDPTRAVAYQSYYDSLNPEDGPSRAIAGDVTPGSSMTEETPGLVPLLMQGYTVIVADTEGPKADFAAGPEYGMTTLDSIRAATQSPRVGLDSNARVALMGYSGGAIASNWAAVLAPSYAPDVNRRLVGVAEGGVLVDPAHNLKYVNGSLVWSGVAAMALIGVTRSYNVDMTPYLSDYGKKLMARLNHAAAGDTFLKYPGLSWTQMVKPRYADPRSVPAFMNAVRKINLGRQATPKVPMLIDQGTNGILEGTNGANAATGPGDGVMVAADVRSLARQYCATGATVDYTQYGALSHVLTGLYWTPQAIGWINDRFAGRPAPTTCGRIAPGNPLIPEM